MIGAIADDFTGGTDIATAFRQAGLRTLILFGTPTGSAELPDSDVVVIALKTRTVDPSDAVVQSLAALNWLRTRGASQIFFKYCSTFDSRPEGNIGPVTDALREALAAPQVVFVPASPRHLRTQYLGQLFVDLLPLAESPMRHHPLTPMTDSCIPRVLANQTSHPVGLVAYPDVRAGRDHIRQALDGFADQTYIVIDALTDTDLVEIGHACVDDVLVTGAAGLAAGLGAAIAQRTDRAPADADEVDPIGDVPAAVLAGSCSARTLEQIAFMQEHGHPSYRLDAIAHPDADLLAGLAVQWYDQLPTGPAPLIYSSLPPDELRRAQAMGSTSEVLEAALGTIGRHLTDRGVRRLVVAGGETSGAVVTALRVTGGLIGSEAAPGVPWIYTAGQRPVALLLKSGNFGDPELLARAAGGGKAGR